MATFTPPTIQVMLWTDPLMRWFSIDEGVSIIKTIGVNGPVYRAVQNPTSEELAAAAAFYLGGRTYEIDEAEAGYLIAAGYGAGVVTDNTAFGAGVFGSGAFGS